MFGTLIENKDREIIIPGDENSLLIHHSDINHQPVMPLNRLLISITDVLLLLILCTHQKYESFPTGLNTLV